MMAEINTLRLLNPGARELNLYGDGSFCPELGLGAWAYRVPSLGIAGVGVECGSDAGFFEFAAVVAGIEAVAAVDITARPIHVHTDSEFVWRLLVHMADGAPLPSRSRFEPIRALYSRVAESSGARRVVRPKRKARRKEVRECHLDARQSLKGHIRASDTLTRALNEQREKQELAALTKHREQLDRRVEDLQEERRLCDLRVQTITQRLNLATCDGGVNLSGMRDAVRAGR